MNWPIPYAELQFQYIRSRGPGGQHVNRTNSACVLRWRPTETNYYHGEEKERLLQNLQAQLTVDGDLLIRSEQHRDQESNRKSCLEKLAKVISSALHVQKPRKKTKPKRSAVQKRLKGKELRGELKANRQKIRT